MSSVPYQYSGVETLIMAAQLDSLRANAAMSNNIQLPSSIPFQSMPLFSQPQQQYAPAGHNAYQHQHQHQHPHQHQHQQPQPSSAPSQPPPMVQPQQSTPKELMLQAPFKIPISLQAREPNQVPTPRNKSELELYHVLKQANLLDYYQTFIKLGGDDLEQLAEAEKNEEEFLEIVQLVGMSSKPLHVRRFQKAVRRWRENKSEPLDVTSRPQADIYYDTGCNVSQDFSFRSDLTHCSSVLDESVAPSTASRSLFPPEDHDYQSRYCTPPHQIIKNAPKRPRLMDSIMPNDLTKGIQIEDSATKEETPRRQRFSNLRISPIRAEALSSVLPSDERRQRGNRLSPPDSPVSQASYPNSETSHSPLEALDEEPQEEKKKKPITMNKRKRLLKKPSPTNLEEFYNTKNPVHQIAKPSKASDLTE